MQCDPKYMHIYALCSEEICSVYMQDMLKDARKMQERCKKDARSMQIYRLYM